MLKNSKATLLILIPVLALAAGCHLVGTGTLEYVPQSVPNEPAAVSGSVATIHAFRADATDSWPPNGKVALWVRAGNIPPLRTGDQLYLVRLFGPREAAPAYLGYRTCDDLAASGSGRVALNIYPGLIVGSIRLGNDRTISEVVLIDDTPDVLELSWMIANDDAFYTGLAIRCGSMVVVP